MRALHNNYSNKVASFWTGNESKRAIMWAFLYLAFFISDDNHFSLIPQEKTGSQEENFQDFEVAVGDLETLTQIRHDSRVRLV